MGISSIARSRGVLTMDRSRGLTTLPAPQLGQELGERSIAMVTKHQAQREYRLPTTAMRL